MLNFLKNLWSSIKTIRYFVQEDQNVYNTLIRALWYVLIKPFFLAIGWSYLHDFSHKFLKRLKLLKLHVRIALFSTDNGQALGLSIFHFVSNHKNFIPKYFDNAQTDFA